MTARTAQKHDPILNCTADVKPVEEVSGREPFKGDPDALDSAEVRLLGNHEPMRVHSTVGIEREYVLIERLAEARHGVEQQGGTAGAQCRSMRVRVRLAQVEGCTQADLPSPRSTKTCGPRPEFRELQIPCEPRRPRW